MLNLGNLYQFFSLYMLDYICAESYVAISGNCVPRDQKLFYLMSNVVLFFIHDEWEGAKRVNCSPVKVSPNPCLADILIYHSCHLSMRYVDISVTLKDNLWAEYTLHG